MIRLLSTDFDYTIVNHDEPSPVAPAFLARLEALRAEGLVWAVNTGRSPRLLDHGLREFGFPRRPDFALTSEREVLRPAAVPGTGRDGTDWEDFGDWNLRCERAHAELFDTSRATVDEVLAYLERETGAQALFDPTPTAGGPRQPAGLVAADEPEMDRIAAFLDGVRARCPDLSYQRNKIYLRFCHAGYDKGIALGELGRLLDIGPESILAVGDHHNDLPMLTGLHARHVACPGNAIDEVKTVVRAAGGHVAAAPCSLGVLEALERFCGA